jgi:acyl-CoA thioesterase-2
MTTDAMAFLGLETAGDLAWTLPVTPGIATPHGFLFGGCGLGAAISALEAATGRPVVWATAQYLSYAMVDESVDFAVTVAAAGHQITQARAVGTVAGREILTVNAALGARPTVFDRAWLTPPDVLAPERCPVRTVDDEHLGTVIDRLEQRLAAGRMDDRLSGPSASGRSALWVSMADLAPSGAALAVLGDYVPFGIGQALGQHAGGNSLDNTLRVVNDQATTEWVLLDIQVHAIAHGFGHGVVHLWSETGALLATASQSAIVRQHRRDTSRTQDTGRSADAPASDRRPAPGSGDTR